MGIFFGVLSILLWLLFIPVLILTYQKKIRFLYGVCIGAGLFLCSFLLSVYVAGAEAGVSVIDLALNESFERLEQEVRSVADPSLTGENVQQAIENAIRALSDLKKAYLELFPAMLILTSLAFSYILFMAAKLVGVLLKKDVSGALRFCDLRMSKSGAVVGIAAYVAGSVVSNDLLAAVFSNIAMVLLSVLTVCGLSLIDDRYRRRMRNGLVRFLLYLAVFALLDMLLPFARIALLALGAADAFLNLRVRTQEGK